MEGAGSGAKKEARMSRGDPVYAKVNIDILTGEKVSQLTPQERDTYILGYWMLAVKFRLERMPGRLCDARMLATRLTKSRKSVRRHREVLSHLGLVIIHDDKSVTVKGVRARHAKLKWSEYDPNCPVWGKDSSRYTPHTRPIDGIARQHDSTRAREYLSIPNLTPEGKPIVDNSENESGLGLESGTGNGSESGQAEGASLESNSQPDSDSARPAQLTDPFKVRDESWQICNGLGIEDTDMNMSTLASMFSQYPAPVVKQAYLDTKDKQESDKCGTSDVPMQKPALAYLWGCLRKGGG